MNGGSFQGRNIVKFVYAGDSYTAPSGQPLIRPQSEKGSAFHWLGSDGKIYNKGDTIPSEVILTAQWHLIEQFPDSEILQGKTYFFDLSAIESPGIVFAGDNIDDGEYDGLRYNGLPDATLHYTPFTYVGTINSYNLGAEHENNYDLVDEIAKLSTDRSLFVSDYNVKVNVSWTDLNNSGLIYGKNYTAGGVKYSLRNLSGGKNVRVSNTLNNEWDSILYKIPWVDQKISGIKNWRMGYAWVQESFSTHSTTLRGSDLMNYFQADYLTRAGKNSKNRTTGWRPALEILNDVSLESDGLKVATIHLNTGTLGGVNRNNDPRAKTIEIVYTGDFYSAPPSEGINWNHSTFVEWNTSEDRNGMAYAPGEHVPAGTALYAILDQPVFSFYEDEAMERETDLTDLLIPKGESISIFYKVVGSIANKDIVLDEHTIKSSNSNIAVTKDVNKNSFTIRQTGGEAGPFSLNATFECLKNEHLAYLVQPISGVIGHAPIRADIDGVNFMYEGIFYEPSEILGDITFANKPDDVMVSVNVEKTEIEKHSIDGTDTKVNVTTKYEENFKNGNRFFFNNDDIGKYTITYDIEAKDSNGNNVGVVDEYGSTTINRIFYVHGAAKLFNKDPIHLREGDLYNPLKENDQSTFLSAIYDHVNTDGSITNEKTLWAKSNSDSKINFVGAKKYDIDGTDSAGSPSGNLINAFPSEIGKYEIYYKFLIDGSTELNESITAYIHGKPKIRINDFISVKSKPMGDSDNFLDYIMEQIVKNNQMNIDDFSHVNEDGSLTTYGMHDLSIYDVNGNKINGNDFGSIRVSMHKSPGGGNGTGKTSSQVYFTSDSIEKLTALENNAGTVELTNVFDDNLDGFGVDGGIGWEKNKKYLKLENGGQKETKFKLYLFTENELPIFPTVDKMESNFVEGDSIKFVREDSEATDGSTITIGGIHYKAHKDGNVTLKELLKKQVEVSVKDPDIARYSDMKYVTLRSKAENMLIENFEVLSIKDSSGNDVSEEMLIYTVGKYSVKYKAYDISIDTIAPMTMKEDITQAVEVLGTTYYITLHKGEITRSVEQSYNIYVHSILSFESADSHNNTTFELAVPQTQLVNTKGIKASFVNAKFGDNVTFTVAPHTIDISTSNKVVIIPYSTSHPIISSLPTLRDKTQVFYQTVFVNEEPRIKYIKDGEEMQFPTSRRFLVEHSYNMLEGAEPYINKYTNFIENAGNSYTTATWSTDQPATLMMYKDGNILNNPENYSQNSIGIQKFTLVAEDPDEINIYMNAIGGKNRRDYSMTAYFDKINLSFGSNVNISDTGDGIMKLEGSKTEEEIIALLEASAKGKYAESPIDEVSINNITYSYSDITNSITVTATNQYGLSISKVISLNELAQMDILVTQEDDGAPIEGATVTIENGMNRDNEVVITNSLGRATLYKVAGNYNITVTATGYKPMSKNEMISKDTSKNVYFSLTANPVVTFDANGGSVNPSSISTNDNDKLDFLPIPTRVGYTFTEWQMPDGSLVTIDTLYIADTTVIAQWKINPSGGGTDPSNNYEITIKAGEHGSIFPDGGINKKLSVSEYSNQKFVFTPNEGYVVKKVIVDGNSLGEANSYTFENVKRDHTIEVEFKKSEVLENTKTDAKLNRENHFAYVMGIGDNLFEPNRNITRAETVVIFSGLLVEKPEAGKIYSSSFTDIKGDEWYANAIGYMETFGIVGGYEDGTFRADQPITRAEFATIASRFDALEDAKQNIFPDVEQSHWAISYINSAAKKGWVSGYPDKTFKPEQNITRAESVTMVNNVLGRSAHNDFIDRNIEKLRVFKDVEANHWAYYNIIEATNGHEYLNLNGKESWSTLYDGI